LITVVLELAWHQEDLDFADAPQLLRNEDCGCFPTLDRALVKAAAGRQLQPAVHLV
jgi:hypothetical protein